MKTVETWLPVFPGFYGGLFDLDDAVLNKLQHFEGEMNEDEIDAIEWDIESYQNDVGLYACDWIESQLKYEYPDLDLSIKFQRIQSPKYYNFKTDTIYCEVSFDDAELNKAILDRWGDFEDYIKDKYTSRSGFVSSYDNRASVWFNDATDHEHKLGAMLEFLCDCAGLDDYGMYEKCMEACYLEQL